YFLPVNDDGTDQLLVLQHRYQQHRPDAGSVGGGDDARIARGIAGIPREVGDVEHLLRSGEAGDWHLRVVGHNHYRILPPSLGVSRGRGVHGYDPQGTITIQEQIAEFGLTDAYRVFQHSVEHRLQVAR